MQSPENSQDGAIARTAPLLRFSVDRDLHAAAMASFGEEVDSKFFLARSVIALSTMLTTLASV